jgi:hypothetical protein
MRKALMVIVGFVAVALFPLAAGAAGIKLTQQQVSTVCGKGMTSHGGSSGCTKSCGLNGEHECKYHCYKGKECQGECTTCGVKSRTVMFPGFYANRMVRQSVRGSQ